MEKTLAVVNDLEALGLIRKYAIGGAIGLLFYSEPVTTYDLDLFCVLPESSAVIVTLQPITDELRKRGYVEEKEHVVIEGLPVQFLPAYNELVAEALENACDIQYKNTPTRVLRCEYLLAIMLQTGRPKDRSRLLDVIDQTTLDHALLNAILEKHQLADRWREWTQT